MSKKGKTRMRNTEHRIDHKKIWNISWFLFFFCSSTDEKITSNGFSFLERWKGGGKWMETNGTFLWLLFFIYVFTFSLSDSLIYTVFFSVFAGNMVFFWHFTFSNKSTSTLKCPTTWMQFMVEVHIHWN